MPNARRQRRRFDDDDDRLLVPNQLNRDYYAILNVSRHATLQDIRNAYFSLSRALHPDKQPGGTSADAQELRAAANSQFHIVERAYRVLSDPVSRKMYDQYGEEGVHAVEAHENVVRDLAVMPMADEKLQEYLEDAMRQANQHRLEAHLQASGAMNCEVSIAQFLDDPRAALEAGDAFIVSNIMIQQNVTSNWSKKDKLNIGGHAVTRNSMGMGSLVLSNSRQFSALSEGRIVLDIGNALKTTCALSRRLSTRSHGTIAAIYGMQGLQLTSTVSRQLTDKMNGHWTWTPGQFGHMEVGVRREGRHTTTISDIKFWPSNNGLGASLGASLARDWTERSRGKIAVSLGTNGASVELSAGRTLSAITRMNVGVSIGTEGVTLKLRYTRSGMRFIAPVFLCPITSPKWKIIATGAGTLPIMIAAAVKQIVKQSQKAERQKRKNEELYAIREHQKEARKHAQLQQSLMAKIAKQQRDEEEARQGLVILRAKYGLVKQELKASLLGSKEGDSQSAGAIEHPLAFDVTVPLQFFVKDGVLDLFSGSKSELLGFYNPLLGEPLPPQESRPKLFIRYAYKDTVFDLEVEDKQAVTLPSRLAKPLGKVGLVS